MFAGISLNPDEGQGKGVNGVGLEQQKHQFSFGRNEWQQDWKSTQNREFSAKNIRGNRVDLNKPYLKPNYSNFEYVHFPNKEPFLTSNKRDFKPIKVTKGDNNSNNKEFIRASRIVLGEYPEKSVPTYTEIHKDPKEQRSKFNYDKINFTYNPYNVHPITSELIFKPNHQNWSFDYYNKDKPKNYVSNDKPMALNTNLRKVYDPITNRYFK